MRRSIPAGLAAALISAAPASAAVPHTVVPGETLWSIAAASNFTTRSLAAANGLSPEAQVVAGSTIQIPSEAEAAAALAGAGPAAQAAPASQGAAPPPAGAYKVRVGDTLSGLAARSGVTAKQIAFMNGLDPEGHVLAGTVLKLPTAGAAQARASAPAPAPATTRVADVPPYATPGFTNAQEIGQIAAAHGVSQSLAAGVAWQESGFNNGLVSSANARGVMQILPGTWSWIQERLAAQPLDPASPRENVHAGVMYLGQLIHDTGGDERRAVASYYQGLGSVQSRGLFPETEQYVDAVMAHRQRFGGP